MLDTLAAYKEGCVGMAANMIGVNRRVIAFGNGGSYMLMFNPEIIKKSQPYETRVGCLSLDGVQRQGAEGLAASVRNIMNRFKIQTGNYKINSNLKGLYE